MKLDRVVMTIPGQHPQLLARRTDAGATAILQDEHFHGTGAETGQPTRTYAYDPAGNRTSKAENGGTTTYAAANPNNFIWDGGRIIQKRIGGTTAYSCTNYFQEGEIRCLNNSLTRYYHTHDQLGSVYEITNTAGAVQAAYSFAAYGERTKRWGSENTEIAYTGHWNLKPAAFAKQAAADLSLTWFRAYDPKRGVWLSEDPLQEEGGINRYGYVNNSPLQHVDPLGLKKKTITVAPCEIVVYAGHNSDTPKIDVKSGIAGPSRQTCWAFAFIGCNPESINSKVPPSNLLDSAPRHTTRMFSRNMGTGFLSRIHHSMGGPFSDDSFNALWKKSIPDKIQQLRGKPCCCIMVKLRIIVTNDEVLADSGFKDVRDYIYNRRY